MGGSSGESGPQETFRRVLVAGASGFIGSRLVPALLDRGYAVRAAARRVPGGPPRPNLERVRCDLLAPRTLAPALEGVDAAYYLVHSLGKDRRYGDLDRRAATNFVEAAAAAGLRRIIYLGGVAPKGRASEHLASRLEVGSILRNGRVPALELRAAMIVGAGSASWQIVRDLALRLPAMVLPAWTRSRLSPIALEDAIEALLLGLEMSLPESAYYDIPGQETLSGREILQRIAALDGRRIPAITIPWLTPKLSALWLRIITRADFSLARELVYGLTGDLLPSDRRYWELSGHQPAVSFDDAARAALEEEHRARMPSRIGDLEEMFVRFAGARLKS